MRSRPPRLPTGRRRWALRSALPARFMAERARRRLIVAEDFAGHEWARSMGRGSSRMGSISRRLVFVRAPDALGAVSGDGGGAEERRAGRRGRRTLAPKKYDLAISRRLLLAARAGAVPALLVQASAYGAADGFRARPRRVSRSPPRRARICPRRAAGAACRGRRPSPRGSSRRASPRRRARPSGLDTARIIRLTWRSEDKQFDEPAISLPLAAASGDGPRAARA